MQSSRRFHNGLAIAVVAACISGFFPVVLIATLTGCGASAPQASTPPAGQSATPKDHVPIPDDPEVLQGTLGNGLTYYVRRHAAPSKGAYLGLVIKAGWANESEGQQGLEHLVKHMAFSGTPRFESDRLQAFLRQMGIQASPDTNVVTSVGFTVYGLAVPADSGEALFTAVDLLGEWSSAIPFEPARVERERRAVLVEMDQPRALEHRFARQVLDILLRGEGPAARLSSQAEDVVEAASPEQLRAFYRAWYRPERMALIAVGEFDPKRVEQAIRNRFAGIKAQGPTPPDAVPLPQPRHDTAFATLEAPEPEEEEGEEEEEPEDEAPPFPAVVSIGFKRPRSPIRTPADVRQSVIEAAYGSLVQARLVKLAQRPGSPLTAVKWFSVPQLPLHLSVAQAVVQPKRLAAGLQALWAELRGIGLNGFEPNELAVAVQTLKSSPVADSMDYAQGMIAHFLYGDALISAEARRNLEQEQLVQIGVSDVNDFAKSISRSAAKVVLASGPEEQLLPEQALRAAVARAESQAPGSAPAGAIGGSLIEVLPTPGSVLREETIDEIGTTVWRLSNGATVVIKPTRFQLGEVLFQARAAGGTSLASDRDYWSATLAPQIVTAGGLGRHGPQDLQELLTGRSAEGRPWMSETEHGIRAKAAPEDLELMMQLVYLGFTAPRGDAAALEGIRAHWREQLLNRDADPDQAFAEVRRQYSSGGRAQPRSATLKSVEQLSLPVALEFYRQRFSQASDFTFVIVGDIEGGRLKPLVERYLASLPDARKDRKRDVQGPDVGARLAYGVKRVQVGRGEAETSTVMLAFQGQVPWSHEAKTSLDALRRYIEIRARETLPAARSLSVTAELERRPTARSSLSITFVCSRTLVDQSKRLVLGLIREAQAAPARESDVAIVREAAKQHLEREWGTNAFWLQALGEAQALGSDPRGVQKLRGGVAQIDAAMIERAARNYFDTRRYVEVVR